MKRPVRLLFRCLFGLLLITKFSYQAFGAEADVYGLSIKPQDPNEYVTSIAYKGRTLKQKRTPADKLKGKASAEIARVEAALAACSANLLADDLKPICTDQQYFDVQLAIKRIAWLQPDWSTSAYDAENDFYRSENYWRIQRRDQAEREHARFLQADNEARERHYLDSTYRVQQRRDSTARVARAKRQASLDSLDEPRRRARAYELDMALLTPAGRRLFEASAKPTTKSAAKVTSTRTVSHRVAATGARVYVCDGGSAYAYHTSSGCPGLNRCSSGISATSLTSARNMGRTPCQKCH